VAAFDPSKLLGRVLDDRYRIVDLLGSGAMGSVFRAQHVRLPRELAIKVLHPELAEPKLLQRFEREARLAGKLGHPNVVSVLDVGELDGLAYMVMDLAPGRRLGALFHGKPFTPARAMRILRQLCDGLDHAHERGLVHRDLKPDNIMIEAHGHEELARIVDFGIAILRDGAGAEGRVTTRGIVLGTPHYMAPELATGRPFDHRVDLFALGVIAYEMLTGVMPFEGTGVQVVYANVEQDAPAMAARAPGVAVPPDLEAFACKLMARSLDERFPTALAARDALDRLAAPRTTRMAYADTIAMIPLPRSA